MQKQAKNKALIHICFTHVIWYPLDSNGWRRDLWSSDMLLLTLQLFRFLILALHNIQECQLWPKERKAWQSGSCPTEQAGHRSAFSWSPVDSEAPKESPLTPPAYMLTFNVDPGAGPQPGSEPSRCMSRRLRDWLCCFSGAPTPTGRRMDNSFNTPIQASCTRSAPPWQDWTRLDSRSVWRNSQRDSGCLSGPRVAQHGMQGRGLCTPRCNEKHLW